MISLSLLLIIPLTHLMMSVIEDEELLLDDL
mgnify:CR=1 FL=1